MDKKQVIKIETGNVDFMQEMKELLREDWKIIILAIFAAIVVLLEIVTVPLWGI